MSVAYNTTLANTIVQKWDMDVLEYRYANSVLTNRVLNKSDLVVKIGDTITINIEPALAVGTVTASTGAFTPASSATTLVNVVVNVWEYVSDSFTDMARVQSFWTAENLYPKAAGKAWGKKFDEFLAGKHAGLTLDAVGSDTEVEAFGIDQATLAMLRMADGTVSGVATNPVPLENLSWILPNIAYFKGWLKDPQLTKAADMGTPKNVLTTGYQSQILGHPMYLSPLLSKSANGAVYKALLLHKEAMAIAFQKNNEYSLVDNKPAGAFTHTAACQSLYGGVVVRGDHGIVINVKAS